MKYLKLLSVICLFVFISCDRSHPKDGLYADIETEKGLIIVELHYEDTPVTVANFVSLVRGTNPKVTDSLIGKKFYDGLSFHRVVPNFMIQGGDIKGNGQGNPGYTFEDEFPKDSLGKLLFSHDAKGVMSMANSGKNTNGSQFFITHKPTTWLDGKHTVFGKVIDGLNIVDSIQKDDKILSVKIVSKGSSAKSFSPTKAIEEATKAKIEAERIAKEIWVRDSLSFSLKMNEKEAKVLESGLKVLDLQVGKGKKVKFGDNLKVHYTGYFQDGKVFDSSYKRKRPIQFNLGGDSLIEGWIEGIALLNEGGKARLFVPYDLGYGLDSRGPIPGKSDLIFDVEVIEIVE